MDFKDLEKKHKLGVTLIKERGYYERLLSEVQYLMKYIDNDLFLKMFSENLFSDIRGVFRSFVRQDLRKVYQEMKVNSESSLGIYLDREYMNLTILQKCTTNLRYQVKSLSRMPHITQLNFKSSFLQATSRKLNGEIQEAYRQLSISYKKYFRMKFSDPNSNEEKISLQCIENLGRDFDDHFILTMKRFYQLADAINFVQALFKFEIENVIRNRIAAIYFERQEKLERVIDYFINDLKRNFIRTMERHLKNGKSLDWIQKGFLQFIDSTRFETLMRRVLLQTLTVMRRENQIKQKTSIF